MDPYLARLVGRLPRRGAPTPHEERRSSKVLRFGRHVFRDVGRERRPKPRSGFVRRDDQDLAPNLVVYEYGLTALFLVKGPLTANERRLPYFYQEQHVRAVTREFGLREEKRGGER